MHSKSVRLGRLIMDPARIKELVNPEFVANGPSFVVVGSGGQIGGTYDALPASLASDPSVFGCFFGRDEDDVTALVALVWEDGVTGFHILPPSVDVRTTTVATSAGESILGGGGAA